MDTATLVSDQIDDGARLIKLLHATGFEVTAAFWVYVTYEEEWYLYIASDVVDAVGSNVAYSKVLGNFEPGRFPSLSRSDIRLIGSQDPMVQTALQYRHEKVPLKYGGRTLGKMIIDEAYLYPKEIA